jgi:hypothetical protein
VLIVVAIASLLLVPDARAQAGDSEAQFIELIAAARSANGLEPLTVSPELTAIARRHAAEMAAAGDIWHQSLDPIDGQRVGENVGTGNPVETVHDMFMSSPGHRREILGQYSDVGVGVVWADGRLYVDELFRLPWAAAPAEEATPVPAAEPTLALAPAPVEMVPVATPPVEPSTPSTTTTVPSIDASALAPAVLAVAAATRPATTHMELASAVLVPARSAPAGGANPALVTVAALMIGLVLSAQLWSFRNRAWVPVRRRAPAH